MGKHDRLGARRRSRGAKPNFSVQHATVGHFAYPFPKLKSRGPGLLQASTARLDGTIESTLLTRGVLPPD